MRERGKATCPELAVATGLSMVTVHKEVKKLCRLGELRTGKESVSRGGRPAQVYEYEARYAQRAFLEIRRQGAVMRVLLELTDLHGVTMSSRETTYAALEDESLDGWLDDTLHRQRVAGIALVFYPTEQRESLRVHLEHRYHCPVRILTAAEALSEGREGGATLYLPRGEAPQCSLHRKGQAQHTGRLDLLPLPVSWEKLDYTDHTLVEEMVARLLQILICTLRPERITIHADIWSTRLTERIRFNTQSKLRGAAPPLSFRTCTPETAHAAVRALAWKLSPATDTSDASPRASRPRTDSRAMRAHRPASHAQRH